MYKLKVTQVKYGWQYEIFCERDGELVLVGVGFRADEADARRHGVEDMKLARMFRCGQSSMITYG